MVNVSYYLSIQGILALDTKTESSLDNIHAGDHVPGWCQLVSQFLSKPQMLQNIPHSEVIVF